MKYRKAMKRISALATTATIMVTAVNTVFAETAFVDVPETAWYYAAVENVYNNGLMYGTSENTFSPEATLTRAMLAAVICRIYGNPKADKKSAFSDTASGSWYSDSVDWCVEAGIFCGYPDGSFKPDEPITREQLAVVLKNCFENSIQATDENNNFTAAKSCEWSKNACIWAKNAGLVYSVDGETDFCAAAKRAEIAWAVYRCFKTESALTKESFIFGETKIGYLLYTPQNAQPNMPLVVYLHGGHGKGSDLTILTETDGFPKYLADGDLGDVEAYVIIPQLPANDRQWTDEEKVIIALIESVCEEKNIDRSCISLAGHSMGGTGTWNIALDYPELFDRIAPMSGTIKTTPANIEALKNMYIWTFVGDEDKVVPPETTEIFIERLSRYNPKANISVFENTDHEGVSEKAWLDTELIEWLIS